MMQSLLEYITLLFIATYLQAQHSSPYNRIIYIFMMGPLTKHSLNYVQLQNSNT